MYWGKGVCVYIYVCALSGLLDRFISEKKRVSVFSFYGMWSLEKESEKEREHLHFRWCKAKGVEKWFFWIELVRNDCGFRMKKYFGIHSNLEELWDSSLNLPSAVGCITTEFLEKVRFILPFIGFFVISHNWGYRLFSFLTLKMDEWLRSESIWRKRRGSHKPNSLNTRYAPVTLPIPLYEEVLN